jgi:sporadic carbohydrate cluster 2OG-Fe(II) oxygenase
MYLEKKEQIINKEYLKKGYVIKDVANTESFREINKIFHKIIKQKLKSKLNYEDILDNTHKLVNKNHLNEFRLYVIKKMNQNKKFKKLFYDICKPYVNSIVGNELVMQKNLNLSIQNPKDDSSLLDVHSDTWAGDSSYEVVVWFPLVDCFSTKSMYIMSKQDTKKYSKIIFKNKNKTNFNVYNLIKKKIKWLKVDKGKVLIFNQNLIHGNHINKEKNTRWSLNCRFKSIFTPYAEKSIGEFFEPITLRPATKDGMIYTLPKI